MATLPTRIQAQASAITPTTLIHIVVTGDTSQSPQGSSYKATLGQLTSLFGGNTDLYITGGTYSVGTLTLNRNDGNSVIVTGFTEPFSGGSGNCITDLYVSNIHSCSPLNINPLDEGNVYFGSTSGITVDVINNRIGIGTNTPTSNLQIKGIGDTVLTDSLSIQNSGGTTNIRVTDLGSLGVGNNSSLNGLMVYKGLHISNNTSSYISLANSNTGKLLLTGLEDGDFNYQAFIGGGYYYYGDGSNGSSVYTKLNTSTGNWLFSSKNLGGVANVAVAVPDAKVTIVGSGNTSLNNALVVKNVDLTTDVLTDLLVVRNDGNIGINTGSPTEKLDVSGKTKTINFQMTSGATNGYVLTSDASGNASWQVSSGGSNIYNSDGNLTGVRILDLSGSTLSFIDTLGTTTFNGGNILTISGATLQPASIQLDADSGQDRILEYTTQGSSRWRIQTEGNEIGGDFGSDLVFNSYDDSGVPIETVLRIERSNGRLYVNESYFLPKIDGTSGQVLTTDGSGDVTWQTPSGGVSIDPYNNLGNVNTITWNVSGNSTNYQATLTGNTTLALTNVRNGEYGTIILTQDGVGGRTITLGNINGSAGIHRVANGGGGSVVLTSNANAVDILTFTYNGSVMYWTVGNDYT